MEFKRTCERIKALLILCNENLSCDSHEICAVTKQRVLDKARQLNYEANPFASSLRKQKCKTIA